MSQKKRKYTIELLNDSKVYADKWRVETMASIGAVLNKMIVKAEDAIYERKGEEKTEHKEIWIPIFSITVIYENH